MGLEVALGELNDQQRMFVEFFCTMPNPTASAAARKAGYNERYGRVLLNDPRVALAVREFRGAATELALVGAADIQDRLWFEARNAGSDSARVKALEVLARIHGLLDGRRDAVVRTIEVVRE